MSKDINVTDGTVLETLNNKVDLDGGNYIGSPLEEYIYEQCGANTDLSNLSEVGQAKFDEKANKTEISTELAKKLDTSKVNAYLTETYSSGTSWYRIWSNGWCEQGGRTSSSAGSTARTVTLLHKYTNANYSLMLTGMTGGSSGNPHFNVFQCTSITATNFTALAECSESLVLGWRAAGWKAS